MFSSATLITEAGYNVDIFLYYPVSGPQVKVSNSRIRIYDLTPSPVTTPSRRTIRSRVGQILPRPICTLIQGIRRLVVARRVSPESAEAFAVIPEPILNQAVEIIGHKPYRCFIGIEQRGLIFAGWLGKKLGIPVIYHSLELYVSDDPYANSHPAYWAVKKLERKYHRTAAATIIQDPERAQVLLADNHVQETKLFFVPVGIKGEIITTRKTYFHEKFKLPSEQKIALHLGSIHPHRLSPEIIAAAENIPDGWTVVMHGVLHDKMRSLVSLTDKQLRLAISSDLVELDELTMLAASANIGLVFYIGDTANTYLIGQSSEKMARYLQCGIPVITNDFPSLKRIVESYNCGVCVVDPAGIPAAIAQISEQYARYREAAFRCYNEKYELSRHYQQFIEYLGR
jgi:glycosyltransferase involved in cell wall biosynthesis